MEPVSLTYSNPAVEPLPVPPGPPDPPIPPELLAEPARRRLVPRPIARPWQVLVGTVLGYLTAVGLFVALPADSIAEVLLLRYGHETSAAIRSIDAIPSKNQENVRVEFIYDAAEQRVKDDAEVTGNVLAEIQRVGRVPLRTATIGRWHVAVVRMPWTEFARLRWVPWLMSACYLLVVTGAPFISRRPKLPPEETEDGWFAKNGTPIYARMVRNGYRAFRLSSGKVVYQYILPNGRAIKVTAAADGPSKLKKVPPGEPMLVVYDPEDPGRHSRYKELKYAAVI